MYRNPPASSALAEKAQLSAEVPGLFLMAEISLVWVAACRALRVLAVPGVPLLGSERRWKSLQAVAFG